MTISADNLSKDSLRKEFAKNANEYYKVELFKKEGFSRYTCRICGKNFWSIKEREVCEDSSHSEYSFFKEKPRSTGYVEFWKKFADYFKKHGHAEAKSYPVVSRWRQDLYFTIASIQDFQRIENGKMSFEYNSNPLIVPQMCLRFGDIENVGVTGRHFTSFMMAGQHSFNYPKEGYWKDRCIELNYGFLTEVLGVKREDLVYNEDVWAMPDFSEFGPSLETFANGAELVNSVFTQFEYVNGGIKELDGKVVDVGWGFDRLLWFYTGYEDAYSAVFENTIKKLRPKINIDLETKLFKKFAKVAGELDIDEVKNAREKELQLLNTAGISLDDYEKKIKPTQAFYAIMDHTRTLLFGISYGSLPSNIGGGYNLRLVLRRSLDFIDKYKLGISITDIAKMQAEELRPLYPELMECINSGEFDEVIEIEKKRYLKSRENSSKIVEQIIGKKEKLDAKRLSTLYESNGISPDFIKAVAAEKNVKIDIPENIYAEMIVGDLVKKEKARKLDVNTEGITKTEQLYYKLAEQSESKILKTDKNYVILDKTPFYPEGGGQEADHGAINGVKVTDAQKLGDVIVHVLAENVSSKKGFKAGEKVQCEVDKERRRRLMVHHTSVHLTSAAARSVLGKHAWQEGTKKSFEKAHIDVAHYDKLNDEQIKKIENFINSHLFDGIKVTVKYMERKEAESRYGFEIYQGHGVPAQNIRIVLIESKDGKFIDAEACGGLHVTGMEQAIGTVKIINTERISDGIDRIELAAGNAALDYFRRYESELSQSATKLNTDALKVAERITVLDDENRKMRKLIEEYKNIAAEQAAISLAASNKIDKELDMPRDMLRIIATKITGINSSAIVLLKNKNGEVVCISGEKSKASAIDYIKGNIGAKKFVGGGSVKFAEGKIV